MNKVINWINSFIYRIFYSFILFYQKIISPILPARCRYYPTCSNYGKQALIWHGVWAGSWLLLKRIGRCHPLGGHGIDFVPLPLASYKYSYRQLPAIKLNAVNKSLINDTKGINVYRDSSSYVARLNHLMSRQQ